MSLPSNPFVQQPPFAALTRPDPAISGLISGYPPCAKSVASGGNCGFPRGATLARRWRRLSPSRGWVPVSRVRPRSASVRHGRFRTDASVLTDVAPAVGLDEERVHRCALLCGHDARTPHAFRVHPAAFRRIAPNLDVQRAFEKRCKSAENRELKPNPRIPPDRPPKR